MRKKIVFLAIFSVLAVLEVFARAGGGGGFGGGGGGNGGGGGGAEVIFLLIRLIIHYPLVGVPVTVVAVVLFYYGSKKGVVAYQGRQLRLGHQAMQENAKKEKMAELKAADPRFSETEFLNRVKRAFLKIQKAWCAQDLDTVCPFISDSIHERFTLQLNEQKADNVRDRMENIRIQKILIAQVDSDECYDSLTVRVRASAVDYRVSLTSGDRLSGAEKSETFVEYWSFLRRRGVQTAKGKKGLMEGHCPNCGAAIVMNQFARCKYCKAILKSGAHDWVLAEITQASEWISTPPEIVPGVAEYRKEKDRHFNLQHLEDRASVMFWRYMLAHQKGDRLPLTAVATRTFLADVEKVLKREGDRGRKYYKECAVGAVAALGIMPGTDADLALVEVRWSAVPWRVRRGEAPVRCGGKRIRSHVMVLQRKAGVVSDAEHGIDSAHCPGCGAPESGSGRQACEFCGEAFPGKERSWMLHGFCPLYSRETHNLLEALREAQASALIPKGVEALAGTIQSSAGGLAWMVKVLVADGRIDDRERAMMDKVARKHRVPSGVLSAMIQNAEAGTLSLPEPHDFKEARAWLRSMIVLGLADGNLAAAEMKLIQAVGEKVGMVRYDVQHMIKKVRREQLKEARVALKRRSVFPKRVTDNE